MYKKVEKKYIVWNIVKKRQTIVPKLADPSQEKIA